MNFGTLVNAPPNFISAELRNLVLGLLWQIFLGSLFGMHLAGKILIV